MRHAGSILTTAVILIAALALAPADAQTPVTGTPGATPALTELASLLPTRDELPENLAIIQDGARTLDDVVSGLPDPEDAARRFQQWGWQGNVVRAFHVEDTTTDPNAVDGVYISIHRFGSPDAARAALAWTVDVHQQQDPNVTEQGHAALGDGPRVLWGEQVYGSEVTIYVQQGSVVVRLSANSPAGDPSAVAWKLVETILARPYFDR